MSPELHHECTRVPVTSLTSCGSFFTASEGPYLRFYHRRDFHHLFSKRIFRAQAVHGVTVFHQDLRHVLLIVWGGHLVCILEFSLFLDRENAAHVSESAQQSKVVRATDWILDISCAPTAPQRDLHGRSESRCAAVTAHNALIAIDVENAAHSGESPRSPPVLSLTRLTSSSRSILYSAQLVWASPTHILVAAGTAFGEVVYWSWLRHIQPERQSRIHQVFVGHEGSIFGVAISPELHTDNGQKRFLASCSDDRTIRIWDVSNTPASEDVDGHQCGEDKNLEIQRTRHTGFSNESFDSETYSQACLAIGWGHISRVWTVRFLEKQSNKSGIYLLSSGEDATSRIWKLDNKVPKYGSSPSKLLQSNATAFHDGKNIWSMAIQDSYSHSDHQQVICGAADSKVVAHTLLPSNGIDPVGHELQSVEYTIQDITSTDQNMLGHLEIQPPFRSSKKAEFFRSYTFIGDRLILLTTNSGKIYTELLNDDGTVAQTRLVAHFDDLSGYSICNGNASRKLAFIAGSRRNVYLYDGETSQMSRIHTVDSKVGGIFISEVLHDQGSHLLAVLFTLLDQKEAQLLHIGKEEESTPVVTTVVTVPLYYMSGGQFTVTSMTCVDTRNSNESLLLGSRGGSVAMYQMPKPTKNVCSPVKTTATPIRLINFVHGKETVTSLSWRPSPLNGNSGHLTSVGRNGCLAVHALDLLTNSVQLVHDLALPIGPNLEGHCFRNDHLLVYGFSSKRFVLHDVTAEEEIMNADTSGAHRSWAFNLHTMENSGGTLVWTKASSMHICKQNEPNHAVIRTGGHGREIKDVAVSNATGGAMKQLIATGAEDTNIKLFEYIDEDFICRRTLRKHTTGIQHLKWSEDGNYLFSSGGCEEFYIWRIRTLPSPLGIGVVCESVCPPESEFSDLRVMSFDIKKHESGFMVAMVFSNSNIRVYNYDPGATVRWQIRAKGLYFTSCLTQCLLLSSNLILTAGSDGHAVVWPTRSATDSHSNASVFPSALAWQDPVRLHQSSSKALGSCSLTDTATLVVSGGDDGSLSFLVASIASRAPQSYAFPPSIVTRAHASATTSCAIFRHNSVIFVVTSGNDQWVRVWSVVPSSNGDSLEITRLGKIKTNIADASSMAVLASDSKEACARILICGVGMEVVRVEWPAG